MNYETVELKTERLILKKGTLKDFLRVYEYDYSKLKDIDDVCKLVRQDQTQIKKWFKKGKEAYYNKVKKAKMFDWIIYLNDKAIANILSTDEDFNNRTIEISCNLHPSYWGMGYANEALCAVINYLFSLGYENIVCRYSDGNKRAKKTLDKLGFKPYEIVKDSFISESGNMIDEYKTIMTKDDWLFKTQKIKVIK